MNLYLVQYDGESYYVEAATLHAAIEAWQSAIEKEWDSGDFNGEEPDSIALVHASAVIR